MVLVEAFMHECEESRTAERSADLADAVAT
jgi:hypothetical protein